MFLPFGLWGSTGNTQHLTPVPVLKFGDICALQCCTGVILKAPKHLEVAQARLDLHVRRIVFKLLCSFPDLPLLACGGGFLAFFLLKEVLAVWAEVVAIPLLHCAFYGASHSIMGSCETVLRFVGHEVTRRLYLGIRKGGGGANRIMRFWGGGGGNVLQSAPSKLVCARLALRRMTLREQGGGEIVS